MSTDKRFPENKPSIPTDRVVYPIRPAPINWSPNASGNFGKQIAGRWISIVCYPRRMGSETYISSFVSEEAMDVLNRPSLNEHKYHLFDPMDRDTVKIGDITKDELDRLFEAVSQIPDDVADLWQEIKYIACCVTGYSLSSLISPHRENAEASYRHAIYGPWGAEYKPFVPVKPNMGELTPVMWLSGYWWLKGIGRVKVGEF